jgi:hypothetical protein
MVEYMPSMHKTLGVTPSSIKKKKEEEKIMQYFMESKTPQGKKGDFLGILPFQLTCRTFFFFFRELVSLEILFICHEKS